MNELLVWYRYIGIGVTGSMHLTIQYKSIAYTIAEFESRNQDMIIESYMDENNDIISVPWVLTI